MERFHLFYTLFAGIGEFFFDVFSLEDALDRKGDQCWPRTSHGLTNNSSMPITTLCPINYRKCFNMADILSRFSLDDNIILSCLYESDFYHHRNIFYILASRILYFLFS